MSPLIPISSLVRLSRFLSRHPKLVDFIRRRLTRPYFNLPGYMNRDWLLKPPVKRNDPKYGSLWQRFRRANLPIGIRFHEILRPDRDRHLHDHPWWFVSLILRGGYMEEREAGVYAARMPGSVNCCRLSDAHRITHLFGPTLTLVICGMKSQEWGFYTPEGWVNHRDYLGIEGEEDETSLTNRH